MPLSDSAQWTCKVFIYSLLIPGHDLLASFRLYPGEKLRMEQKRGQQHLTRHPCHACEHVRETIVCEIHPQLHTRAPCLTALLYALCSARKSHRLSMVNYTARRLFSCSVHRLCQKPPLQRC